MKYIFSILAAMLLLSCSNSRTVDFYVAPDGDDAGPGTLEQPFRTIGQAQKAVRGLADRKVDVRVLFRGGTYPLAEKVRFTVEDSAPEGYVCSYEAYEDEVPVFTSAIALEGWTKTTDYPAKVDPSVFSAIYEVSYPEGLSKPYVLFRDGQMIHRSRKGGFTVNPITPLRLEEHVEHPDNVTAYNACRSMNVYRAGDRSLLSQFGVRDVEGVLKPWTAADELEVGFAPVPWVLNILPVEKVDVRRGIIYTSLEANSPAGAKGSHTQPWIENALEYLTPGTFAVRGNKIYYCRKGEERLEDIHMPTSVEYFLIEGDIDEMGEDVPVRNLAFRGLTFQEANRHTWPEDHKGWGIQHDWDKYDTPNAMLRFRGAENCIVEGCHFTNSGASAIRLDLYCQKITVQNNLIDHVGHMGILLCGYGPGLKDVNKNNEISNNIIHHVGQIITHGAGVFVWQSGGNHIAHNLIHHVPRKGVGICGVRMPILIKDWCDWDEASKTIRWNELDDDARRDFKAGRITLDEYWHHCLRYLHARNNVVEFNEVHHALERLADGAVLNVSGAGTGNVMNSNYVHHILSHASAALRTDDWQCGSIFEKNIVWMSNIAGVVHKGDNDVLNNILINCGTKGYIRFASYPDEAPSYGSEISRNILYETELANKFYSVGYRPSEGISEPQHCAIDRNLFYSVRNSKMAEHHLETYRNDGNIYGNELHSIAADPLFEPAADGKFNFHLRKDSPAFRLGIEQIDVDAIGVDLSRYPERLAEMGGLDSGDDTGEEIRSEENLEASYEFM